MARRKRSYRTEKSILFRRRKFANCHWCGKAMDFDQATVDHVVSLVEGGSNDLANLVLACAPCNSDRNSAAQKAGVVEEAIEAKRIKRWAEWVYRLARDFGPPRGQRLPAWVIEVARQVKTDGPVTLEACERRVAERRQQQERR